MSCGVCVGLVYFGCRGVVGGNVLGSAHATNLKRKKMTQVARKEEIAVRHAHIDVTYLDDDTYDRNNRCNVVITGNKLLTSSK
jgi:hypothetical protein